MDLSDTYNTHGEKSKRGTVSGGRLVDCKHHEATSNYTTSTVHKVDVY